MTRVRLSLQDVQAKYNTRQDMSILNNLIRAFRGIQEKDPEDENSFFHIAGFHGEPFRGPGVTDKNWWGGYCHHGDVLFPTWHRAYVLRLEDALRSIPGCENVTIPFWDECFDMGNPTATPIPEVLTWPTFNLDGRSDNPLYSYTLPRALEDNVEGKDQRYRKHVGYQTVRYPLSGLVGTEKDRAATKIHNSSYADANANTSYLNGNVANWLQGTVQISPDPNPHPKPAAVPDTYSVLSRYRLCLDAPNYTVFSNRTSQNQWIKDRGGTPDNHWVVSLESPHNAMHLAVGGFYQAGEYNADPIIGANGDMGDNETASFDPIFFFHHCFVDYAFWTWQRKHNLTCSGSLVVDKGYAGTTLVEGQPGLEPDTALDMDTPLLPFKKSDGACYTSADVTDIKAQLGYVYGPGSLDRFIDGPVTLPLPLPTATIVAVKRVHRINRTQYPGSFVVRTFASNAAGKKVEISRDAILSRWNVEHCKNCQNKLDVESFVPLDEEMLRELRGPGRAIGDIEYWAEIQTHDSKGLTTPFIGGDEGPLVDDL
ncbi:putative tyrosinase [Neofusicoccum parvum]|uniref:Tyrosinase n=1 Tax=Neofusicoccum parvum TaxID=310453 RepID=A0ACB5SLM9_9PEZI|nr:putative tyrosinase [Neofusicoccum parvum]